jgi:hypothetical protein
VYYYKRDTLERNEGTIVFAILVDLDDTIIGSRPGMPITDQASRTRKHECIVEQVALCGQ